MTCEGILIIITGERNIGKSTFIEALYRDSKLSGIPVIGISEIRETAGQGYQIKNLDSEECFPWAKKLIHKDPETGGGYSFFEEKISLIISSLECSLKKIYEKPVFVFDEYGKMEARDRGLISVFRRFALRARACVVVVRRSILDEFLSREKGFFGPTHVFEMNRSHLRKPGELFDKIRQLAGGEGL